MEFDMDVFAARLRGKRAEADMSQQELATAAHISSSQIGNYENATGTTPGSDKIAALCRVLHCDPNYLLGWDMDEKQGARA